MEGRAIARPNQAVALTCRLVQGRCFNGGPSNCPAKPAGHDANGPDSVAPLQWRAEQLPGQTATASLSDVSVFNGGPSNCPAKRDPSSLIVRAVAVLASMEGRAIARPNGALHRSRQLHRPSMDEQLPGPTQRGRPTTRFNGGPSNCPAKRARTLSHSFNGGPSNCPAKLGPIVSRCRPSASASMEGRAIARPNKLVGRGRDTALRRSPYRPASSCASMEGRAIARPNALSGSPGGLDGCNPRSLQWRAEQLPGQTPLRGRRSRPPLQWRACPEVGSTPPCFNGGPSNCPAKPDGRRGYVWLEACRFNGGPSNCPAKRDSP